jgi:hypothetical protein
MQMDSCASTNVITHSFLCKIEDHFNRQMSSKLLFTAYVPEYGPHVGYGQPQHKKPISEQSVLICNVFRDNT